MMDQALPVLFSEHFALAPTAAVPVVRSAALDQTLQMRLYHQISTKLCIQAVIPMEAYIQRNGPLSDEHPFGEFHWRGLIEEYMRYSWQHLLAEIHNLQIGWVLIPRSFSQHNAMMPSCPGDSMYYPAVIDQDPEYGQLARMACKHIAIMSTRPWWIHVSRLCQLRSFMDVKRYYDEVEYRRKTQNHLIRGAPGAMMDRGTLDGLEAVPAPVVHGGQTILRRGTLDGSQECQGYYDMVD